MIIAHKISFTFLFRGESSGGMLGSLLFRGGVGMNGWIVGMNGWIGCGDWISCVRISQSSALHPLSLQSWESTDYSLHYDKNVETLPVDFLFTHMSVGIHSFLTSVTFRLISRSISFIFLAALNWYSCDHFNE